MCFFHGGGVDRRRPYRPSAFAGEPWQSPEGIGVKRLYTPADLEGLDALDTFPGLTPFLRGPYPAMYTDPAVDDPPVRGLLHRRGVQRVLPSQPRGGPEGPVGRVRPRHPPRLRLGQPARRGRRGHGRRGDRLDLRHAHAVRRHPARPDERVDDHERRRAAGAGALHRGGRGAGREARAAGRDHPERHPQGVHGPEHVHLPAGAVDADHLRHLRVHGGEDAAVQLDLDLRLPHPGGRGDERPRAGVHAGRRRGVHPLGPRRGPGHRRVRPSPELLLGDRHELLHGGRQAARRPRPVGPAGRATSTRRTPSR